MKKLKEMEIAKDAILSEMEASAKGGVQVGTGTNYSGPINPSVIHTYVDGVPYGSDGASGSLFGDSWSATFDSSQTFGRMDIQH